MNIEQFWTIVERVHAASPDDMEAKGTLLATELRQLGLDEVKSFGEHLSDCFFRSYSWDVWGAAFVICDGCSDDSFMDFRFTLISLGRKPFEIALAEADSLAQFDINPDWAQYEGYQYVSSKVYKELGGAEPECDCPECRPVGSPIKKSHPEEPTGIPFIEWEMSSRFPKLTTKYGFKDSSWLFLKDQREKADAQMRVSQKTAELLLNTGIIPVCGLIPPFQVVADLLKSGQAPVSVGGNCNWEPFHLDQEQYWSTVTLLKNMPAKEKASRPELATIDLKLDLECPGVKNFEEWIYGLRKRGLL